MTLDTAIAMIRDRGVKGDDQIDSIDGHFDPNIPATEYEVDVWPSRGDTSMGKQPLWIHFKRRART